MLVPRLVISLLALPLCFATASYAAVSDPPILATAQQKINALSVPFVPNQGQWDRRAAFKANALGGALFVSTEGTLVYSFPGKPLTVEASSDKPSQRAKHGAVERGDGWALTETLIDSTGKARVLKPAGLGPNEAKVSYFTSDNRADKFKPINTYIRVQMGEVYPGVNLQLRAAGNNMEKIFTVAPGHNPAQIQVKLDGAERLEVNAEGQLVAHTGNGPVSFTAPIAFQETPNGQRDAVTVAYALDADQSRYGFALGEYDHNRPLVIDPLLLSTYVGGTGDDNAAAIAIHPLSGDVYVAGSTTSFDLPGTLGGAQPNSVGGGTNDAFVSRFNAALTTRLQSTYVAGANTDDATALAIHPITGDVYVAGNTRSTNLPRFINGAQGANGGGADGFVVRLNAALTDWTQTTYVGGSGDETVVAIAVHPINGDVYVAGQTQSTNLPGASGGAQTTAGGGGLDGFITRFNPTLTARIQSTYLGGSDVDQIFAMTIDPINGDIVVAGTTASTDLPGAFGGFQETFNTGGRSAFISRLNPTLTAVIQSTYLSGGASSLTSANAVAVHPISGEIIVVGDTGATNFPRARGGAQPSIGSATAAAFASRFDPTLTTLFQSTYVGGGNASESGRTVAIHPMTGEIYVGGATFSNTLLGVVGAIQPGPGGGIDGFVVRLNPALTLRLQASFFGGNKGDQVTALAFQADIGALYVAGLTASANLPGTPSGSPSLSGGAQGTFGGGTAGGFGDGFIARVTTDLTANDNLPDAFSFASQANVPVLSVRTSNPAQIGGLFGSAPIYLEGQLGSSYCVSSTNACTCDVNGGFVSTVGTVTSGNYVCARHTAAATTNVVTQTKLHVGASAATFAVSTGSPFTACSLDVDGNGSVSALTDGLMLIRAMLGFTGTNVTNGAIVGAPPRATWAAIQPFLNANCGTNFAP